MWEISKPGNQFAQSVDSACIVECNYGIVTYEMSRSVQFHDERQTPSTTRILPGEKNVYLARTRSRARAMISRIRESKVQGVSLEIYTYISFSKCAFELSDIRRAFTFSPHSALTSTRKVANDSFIVAAFCERRYFDPPRR